MSAKSNTIALAVLTATFAGSVFADQVTCESQGRERKECDMDTRGEVRIEKQLSKAPCTEGVSWGLSKHSVWVEQGCRAVFSSGGGQSAPQASSGGGIPLMNATCGPGIDVHADEHGPVYIDGREAQLKKSNENYYEAKDAKTGTIISIARNSDGTMNLSYTGAHGENGICTMK